MKFLFLILSCLLVYTICFADAFVQPVVPAAITTAAPQQVSVNLPPAWLENALDTAGDLPVIGPVLVTVMKWLGVFASIMTLIVTCVLGIARALVPVLNLAKLVNLASALEAFQSGTIMYWLKFFSMYNAKKPEGIKSGESKAAA